MAKIYLQKQLIGSIEAWLPADEKAQEITHKAKYGKVMCADFSFLVILVIMQGSLNSYELHLIYKTTLTISNITGNGL